MKEQPIHTFQTRIYDESLSPVLQATANLLSQVRRKLYANLMSGKNANDLKSSYISKYQITARHFNACRVKVEGTIRSLRQRQATSIAGLKKTIQTREKKLEKYKKKKRDPKVLFQKQCSLNRLKQRLANLESDYAKGKTHICFGTKKLFHSQFHLENQSFEEWTSQWEEARNTIFDTLGSKDETSGNQTCVATIQEDGKLKLRLRLPNAFNFECGKHLTVSDVYFPYGHEKILAALSKCQSRSRLKQANDPHYKEEGQAISFSFQRDDKGWKVCASVALAPPEWKTSSKQGVIGIDINTDHLALIETDPSGNPLVKKSLPLSLYGKNKKQSLAKIGDACAEIIDFAHTTQKDIVIEKLDFQKKRAALSEISNKSHCRMLSSFAYEAIISALKSRAYRYGVHTHEVNPAFTSIIGRVKFAKRYGLTIHQAAALCIGRRFFGFSEKTPRQLGSIPDGKGAHIDFPVPVRNRGKHVWSLWGAINRKFQAVLAAHFRAAKSRSADPPLVPA